MSLRILGSAVLTLGIIPPVLPAQAPQPVAPAAAAQGPATPLGQGQQPAKDQAAKDQAAKDQEKHPEETPADRIKKLETEKERLQRELDYVAGHSSKGSMGAQIRDKLTGRKFDVKSINAGISKVSAPPPAQPLEGKNLQLKRARLMTPAELQSVLPDVLLTVSGRPVRKQAADELAAYLKTFPNTGADEHHMVRALQEIIRSEAACAAFPQSSEEALAKLQELKAQIEKGTPFGEVAKGNTKGPNADNGGDLGAVTRNTHYGLTIERMAFTTKAGELSPIFRTTFGYNLLLVDRVEQAEKPEESKVFAHLIMLPYAKDPTQAQSVQAQLAVGQIDITVRDDAAMKMLPPMYQPVVDTPPAAGNDTVEIKREPGKEPAAKPKQEPPAPTKH